MKRHFAMAGIVAIAAVLAFGGFVSAAPRSAVAVALPNLPGGTSSSAAAVNDAGQIVGWATTAAGTQHAVVWDHGVITDLGTLPGGTYSAATGVNDKAQVVGYARIRGPFDVAIHGFLWQNGQMTDLQPLQPSSPRVSSTSSASGINNGSRIVGDSAS